METWRLRDILIGIVLLLVGGATLLHTLGVITLDEETAVWATIWVLAGLGVIGLFAYLFQSEKVWLMIIAFCLFFLAATIYISYFTNDNDLVGVALLLVTALAFLMVFFRDVRQWWALVVTWTSLGLAAIVFMESSSFQLPVFDNIRITDDMQGLLFLCSVALGFFFVWLTNVRRLWWALMTAGLTLGVCAAVAARVFNYSREMGAVFMFVIAGVVFFLMWLIRNKENNLGWAIYPAAVLLPFSAFLYLVLVWRGQTQIILSAIFIALGLIFIFSSVVFRGKAGTPTSKYRVYSADQPLENEVTETSGPQTPFVVEEHPLPPEPSPYVPEDPAPQPAEEPEPLFEEAAPEEPAPEEEVVEKPESAELKSFEKARAEEPEESVETDAENEQDLKED